MARRDAVATPGIHDIFSSHNDKSTQALAQLESALLQLRLANLQEEDAQLQTLCASLDYDGFSEVYQKAQQRRDEQANTSLDHASETATEQREASRLLVLLLDTHREATEKYLRPEQLKSLHEARVALDPQYRQSQRASQWFDSKIARSPAPDTAIHEITRVADTRSPTSFLFKNRLLGSKTLRRLMAAHHVEIHPHRLRAQTANHRGVVRRMVRAAHARGWTHINITGFTQRARRAGWRQAQALGLVVNSGYTPDAKDIKWLHQWYGKRVDRLEKTMRALQGLAAATPQATGRSAHTQISELRQALHAPFEENTLVEQPHLAAQQVHQAHQVLVQVTASLAQARQAQHQQIRNQLDTCRALEHILSAGDDIGLRLFNHDSQWSEITITERGSQVDLNQLAWDVQATQQEQLNDLFMRMDILLMRPDIRLNALEVTSFERGMDIEQWLTDQKDALAAALEADPIAIEESHLQLAQRIQHLEQAAEQYARAGAVAARDTVEQAAMARLDAAEATELEARLDALLADTHTLVNSDAAPAEPVPAPRASASVAVAPVEAPAKTIAVGEAPPPRQAASGDEAPASSADNQDVTTPSPLARLQRRATVLLNGLRNRFTRDTETPISESYDDLRQRQAREAAETDPLTRRLARRATQALTRVRSMLRSDGRGTSPVMEPQTDTTPPANGTAAAAAPHQQLATSVAAPVAADARKTRTDEAVEQPTAPRQQHAATVAASAVATRGETQDDREAAIDRVRRATTAANSSPKGKRRRTTRATEPKMRLLEDELRLLKQFRGLYAAFAHAERQLAQNQEWLSGDIDQEEKQQLQLGKRTLIEQYNEALHSLTQFSLDFERNPRHTIIALYERFLREVRGESNPRPRGGKVVDLEFSSQMKKLDHYAETLLRYHDKMAAAQWKAQGAGASSDTRVAEHWEEETLPQAPVQEKAPAPGDHPAPEHKPG